MKKVIGIVIVACLIVGIGFYINQDKKIKSTITLNTKYEEKQTSKEKQESQSLQDEPIITNNETDSSSNIVSGNANVQINTSQELVLEAIESENATQDKKSTNNVTDSTHTTTKAEDHDASNDIKDTTKPSNSKQDDVKYDQNQKDDNQNQDSKMESGDQYETPIIPVD